MLEPSPYEAVDAVLRDRLNTLHTAYPGRLVRYYPEKQTVDVQLCVMREVPGEDHEPDLFEEVPELVNIPVVWPRAGGFVITFPLNVGDYVAVFCGTTNTLLWREKGGTNMRPGVVGDEFGLNGCFVMPGYYPDNREHTLKDVDTQNMVLRRVDGGAAIAIKPDGSVHITSNHVVVGAGSAPGAVALAELVETAVKSAVTTAVTGHTHSVPALGTSGNGVLVSPVEVASTAAQHLKAT